MEELRKSRLLLFKNEEDMGIPFMTDHVIDNSL